MRTSLAEDSPPDSPKILVLGSGVVRERIVLELESFGLQGVRLSDLGPDVDIPDPLDPDAKDLFGEALRAFRTLGAGARWVHPGVTDWAERTEFQGIVESFGCQALIPRAKNVGLFANTLLLQKKALELGIPNLMLGDDPLFSVRELKEYLKATGRIDDALYPFVLKSAFRVRGGSGVRMIRDPKDLEEWVPLWLEQLRERSGEAMLFVERVLDGARCYVQPFARTRQGDLELFSTIDGSLQFQGRSWIDVCPAQSLEDSVQQTISDHTRKLLDAIDFVGVGVLVFYADGRRVYLSEGLSRLNYGFGLWESVDGTSAVAWQLHTLAPELHPRPPKRRTQDLSSPNQPVGLNLKLYSEDPVLRLPHPGWVWELSEPFRQETADSSVDFSWDIAPGESVSWESIGVLGQLTAVADSWENALALARHSLRKLWVSGTIQTNERFLDELLTHAWVDEGIFYYGFLDHEFIPKSAPPLGWLGIASALVEQLAGPLESNQSWMWMNHKIQPDSTLVRWMDRQDAVAPHGTKCLSGTLESGSITPVRIAVAALSESRWIVRMNQWFIPVRRATRGGAPQLMALVTGVVHSIFVKEGSLVAPRTNVLVIQSLEQLVSHRLPVAVRVKKIKVRPEDVVVVGQELFELELAEDQET
jgi:acetyl/propionyl-CoA carboxylase alpha subunit